MSNNADIKKIAGIAVHHWEEMDKLKRQGLSEKDKAYAYELGAFAATMQLLKIYAEE